MCKAPFLFGVTLIFVTNCFAQSVSLPQTFGCNQLILVQTSDWQATQGTLNFYEWNGQTQQWMPQLRNVAVTVGKNGLAWGEGLHPKRLNDANTRKREGDGKSPAGIFRLHTAFGYAPVTGRKLQVPYLVTDSTIRCVDDPNSAYYNQLVDQDTIAAPDWQSAERMRFNGDDYKYGIVVGYNTDAPVPGNGSCIFLHLWGSPTSPTVGCTAFSEAHMLQLLSQLDAAKRPSLVQLPAAEYRKLKKTYGLP